MKDLTKAQKELKAALERAVRLGEIRRRFGPRPVEEPPRYRVVRREEA